MRVAILGMLFAAQAHADPEWRQGPTFLSAGLAFAVETHATTAIGGELSVHHFFHRHHASGPNSIPLPDYWGGQGLGAYARVEHVTAGDDSMLGLGLGAQATFGPLGIEAGFAERGGSPGGHVAPFVSFGFVSAAFAIDANSQSTVVGLAVTLKLPLDLGHRGVFTYLDD